MNFENILVEQEVSTQIITINRPDQLNALNKKTIEELSIAFKNADSNSEIRVILITGSGNKAFVAGADIKEFANFDAPLGTALSKKGQESLFDLVEQLRTPVIAVINGFALGGGLELAMSAHIRICSENARMGLPEVSLGLIPGYGGTQRLPQLIGRGRANEMIFTAQMIDGNRAFEVGLVNHCVPLEKLMETAHKMAKKIAQNSPTAIGYAIDVVNAGFEENTNGFEEEIRAFGELFESSDFKEGTSAFIEKRRPKFRGN